MAFFITSLCAELTPEARARNLQSFDYVWNTIHDKHWQRAPGGLDWEAVRNEFRPQMEKAQSMAEARAILSGMLARLHQTHFAISPGLAGSDLTASELEDAGPGQTGIDVRVVDGKALVTDVDADSPAAAAGVRPGWEILKVRDTKLTTVLQEFRNQSADELLTRRAILHKLQGRVGQTVAVEFSDGNDQPLLLQINRVPPRGEITKFGYMGPTAVWFDSRRLPGNAGYIHFNLFLDPGRVMPRFSDAVRDCSACDGFILDLRGNPGGVAAMAMGMAGFFIEQPNQLLGVMHLRDSTLKFVVNPRLPQYLGPLAILVDGTSASTAEILAEGLKDLGRARVFGTRTAAAALPSAFEQLPNGDGFQYAMADYISEGGKPLEGLGVTPNEVVPLTRAALLAGHDPVIDAALAWLKTQKQS